MLSPDGLLLGPLSLSWPTLSLLAGLLTWSAVARFPGSGPALGVALVVARVWAAWPGLGTERPLLDNLLDVLDLRRGDWAWGPGLVAGALWLGWPRRPVPAGSARAAALSLLVALLPQALRPVPAQALTVSLPSRVGGDALAAQLGVRAFPTTVVVGPGGQVLARHLGPLSAAQLRRLLRQIEPP